MQIRDEKSVYEKMLEEFDKDGNNKKLWGESKEIVENTLDRWARALENLENGIDERSSQAIIDSAEITIDRIKSALASHLKNYVYSGLKKIFVRYLKSKLS